MKLLELLVQEKVQWPDGALWAVQDGDKELKFEGAEIPPDNPALNLSGTVWFRRGYLYAYGDVHLATLASDWATKAVSKAEYDAAMIAVYQLASVPVQDWYAELAPIIAAAAEGKVVQYLSADGNWLDSTGAFVHPNKYRIKPEEPKTIKVNGFDVPEPMREAPAEDTRYYLASTHAANYYEWAVWCGDVCDTRWLSRGVLHSTKEAAVAHAKAMLGIDPYGTEDADDEHS